MGLLDLHEANFVELGNVCTATDSNLSKITQHRRFISHFGFHPRVVGAAWELLQREKRLRNGCKTKYLLMAFHYVKNKCTESQAHSRFKIHEDTHREWKDYLLRFIKSLKLVS